MPKKPEVSRSLDSNEQVGVLLKSLQHTLRQRIDEALRKEGVDLSFAHFGALFGLHFEPGITGAQLARRAVVSAQTMNSVLRRLEFEGHIERRPHPDSRRADSWSLTENGFAELERARRVGKTVFTKMLGPLDTNEIAAFGDYLQRCIEALGGDTAPRRPALEAPKRRAPRRLHDRLAAS